MSRAFVCTGCVLDELDLLDDALDERAKPDEMIDESEYLLLLRLERHLREETKPRINAALRRYEHRAAHKNRAGRHQ